MFVIFCFSPQIFATDPTFFFTRCSCNVFFFVKDFSFDVLFLGLLCLRKLRCLNRHQMSGTKFRLDDTSRHQIKPIYFYQSGDRTMLLPQSGNAFFHYRGILLLLLLLLCPRFGVPKTGPPGAVTAAVAWAHYGEQLTVPQHGDSVAAADMVCLVLSKMCTINIEHYIHICKYTHTYLHAYMHTRRWCFKLYIWYTCIYLNTVVFVPMHIIYVYIHKSVYIYIYIHIHIHTRLQ